MFRLAAVMYVLAATVIGGSAVTAVLALGHAKAGHIASAFGFGLVVALPVAFLLGKKIYAAINAPVRGHTVGHA